MTNADKQLFLKIVSKRFTDAGLGKIEIAEFGSEQAKVRFGI